MSSPNSTRGIGRQLKASCRVCRKTTRVVLGLALVLLAFSTSGPDAPIGPGEGRAVPTAPPGSEAADTQQSGGVSLDLKTLERRLRETKAIGFFTKLSLKNQVDDLVERFRAFHNGASSASIQDLREHYNLLFLKVLSLLQDEDRELFRDITASREALWDLLADPKKFKSLSKEARSMMRVESLAGAALAMMLAAIPAWAVEDASVKKDLTAVIALHGMPCGQVVNFERRGENDYIATCQDGNRYRIYVNAQGRVVVEKQ